MFELLLERARRVRHVLDAWCTAALCLALGGIPWVGLPLGELCGLVGMGTALRLARDRRFLQGAVFAAAFALWLVVFPFVRLSSAPGEQASPPPPASRRAAAAMPTASPAGPALLPTGPSPVEVPVRPRLDGRPPPLGPGAPAPLESSRPQSEASVPEEAAPDVLDPEGEARKVVERWWHARAASDAGAAAALHADGAAINGKFLTRRELRSSLAEDWRRNEGLVENPAGEMTVRRQGELLRIENPVRFWLARPRIRGQSHHVFIVGERDGSMEIVSHDDAVVPELPKAPSTVNGISAAEMRSAACACLEADLDGEAVESSNAYAREVMYFGSRITRDALLRDKLEYFARWPIRQEVFRGKLRAEVEGKSGASCTFSGWFRTESPERGEWQEGTLEHRFVFARSEGRLLIVAQSGTVTETRKGKLNEP